MDGFEALFYALIIVIGVTLVAATIATARKNQPAPAPPVCAPAEERPETWVSPFEVWLILDFIATAERKAALKETLMSVTPLPRPMAAHALKRAVGLDLVVQVPGTLPLDYALTGRGREWWGLCADSFNRGRLELPPLPEHGGDDDG